MKMSKRVKNFLISTICICGILALIFFIIVLCVQIFYAQNEILESLKIAALFTAGFAAFTFPSGIACSCLSAIMANDPDKDDGQTTMNVFRNFLGR